MLIQFRFQNFKSFIDETILDLSASKITEHSNHIVDTCGEKLLPIAAIYGANASGKSNVIEAFRFMSTYVINSFTYGDKTADKQYIQMAIPFLFDNNSKNKPSLFEIFFTIPGDNREKTYNYGFTIKGTTIVEEWFNTKAKTSSNYKRVYYRNSSEGKLDLSGISKAGAANIKVSLSSETLIASLGNKLKIKEVSCIRQWFLNTSCTNFGDPKENYFISSQLPNHFDDDPQVRKQVIKFFSTFDSSIIDLQIKAFPSDKNKFAVWAIHKTKDGNKASIPLERESSGTLKMFSLFPHLLDTLTNGGVLFVDELNGRLHPLLVRSVLISFLNMDTNPKHAQIIFTAHDVWQLENDSFRRDEIWFTEKNKDGESSLYSLADIENENGVKIRKDENFAKNYLVGKYGAVPTLNIIDFSEDGFNAE